MHWLFFDALGLNYASAIGSGQSHVVRSVFLSLVFVHFLVRLREHLR